MKDTPNLIEIKPFIKYLGIALLLGSTAFAASDSTAAEPPPLWWLNLGLGPGSCSAWSAVTAGISYNITSPGSRGLFTFRYGRADEWEGGIIDFGGPRPLESVWDLGVLYGAITKRRLGFASLTAGLALVGGVKRGAFIGNVGGWFGHDDYEARHFTTMGIPIEAQAFWTPRSSFGSFGLCTGLGLDLYANVNPVRSYKAVSFCLQFGKLWSSHN